MANFDLSYPRNDPEIPSVNSFMNADDYQTTWDDFKVTPRWHSVEWQDVALLAGQQMLGKKLC
ncbi:hypothetical protein CROQUDRAFT_93758 [Cronartium quercuum f. sp. fusiforme G11]|uniref:Uncharacterized protein n=1 Tax=Cronartium quercuum f. sp. fusiforme G11 TaxID=708437 RepID=A0A9P6NGF5_9BASI|nr:hypothetical protein CROQUDRAFT_93758 [Cronartium quercuum f. sp. fusiforme G11]